MTAIDYKYKIVYNSLYIKPISRSLIEMNIEEIRPQKKERLLSCYYARK